MKYEIVEKLMEEKGVKPAEVAKATGIPSSVFTDWKKSRYTPKADKLYALARYFDVPMEYFFDTESAKRGARKLEKSIESINMFKEAVGGEEEYKRISDELEKFEARQKSVHDTADFMVRLSADGELYALVEKVLNGSQEQRDRLLKMAELLGVK